MRRPGGAIYGPPTETLEGTDPADTLTLGFQPPNAWENKRPLGPVPVTWMCNCSCHSQQIQALCCLCFADGWTAFPWLLDPWSASVRGPRPGHRRLLNVRKSKSLPGVPDKHLSSMSICDRAHPSRGIQTFILGGSC